MALTLTTSADIIRRAGLGANSDITGSATLITSLGEEAEGELISDTRRDWITDFSSVNTYVKKKVGMAVSSKAAIKIVLYDGSGYLALGSGEQERILNVLTDDYENAVKLLAATDANDIRGVSE